MRAVIDPKAIDQESIARAYRSLGLDFAGDRDTMSVTIDRRSVTIVRLVRDANDRLVRDEQSGAPRSAVVTIPVVTPERSVSDRDAAAIAVDWSRADA